jgi:VIT1/CCC1 family predicted Fe2+/Mn2+ transporter
MVSWWRSGMETFILGSLAALLAYGVGVLLGGLRQ